MSSHHIVRDEQEPALILHKIGNFPRPVLHALLEWSPTVIGCEPVINKFTSLGHKLDVALVGLQNFSDWQEDLVVQQPITILAVSEENHLMSGLTMLYQDGHKSVNVVTEESSLMGQMPLFSHWIEVLDIVVYTETKRMLIVRAGTFHKWLPNATSLNLVCLAGECNWRISGSHIETSTSKELILSTQKEGVLTVACDSPPFLVIEDL